MRRTASVVAITVLTLLTGCGTKPATPAAPVNPLAVLGHETAWTVATPVIDPAVATKYGPADAQAAVGLAVSMMERYGYSGVAQRETRSNLAVAHDAARYMTASCSRQWAATLTAYGAESMNGVTTKADEDVWALGLDAAFGDGVSKYQNRALMPRLDGPGAEYTRISNVKAVLLPGGRIRVDMTAAGDLLILWGNKDARASFDRTTSFFITKTNGNWLIDGFTGKSTFGKPVLD